MRFWKYQGLGNDFILFEDRMAPRDRETVRWLCDRHHGIGADGILYLGESDQADVQMRIMNADGGEAEMCGNGIRCLAKHVRDLTGFSRDEMTVDTLAGVMRVRCHMEGGIVHQVTVDMGSPALDCHSIPMECDGSFVEREIEIPGGRVKGTAVSMGNPHFVIFDQVDERDQNRLGPLIGSHPLFLQKVNVEFASLAQGGLDLRVFERGVGWTLACGTGACAAAVAAAVTDRLPFDREMRVRLPGGDLWITVLGDLSAVLMRGPAVRVFEGDIDLGDSG